MPLQRLPARGLLLLLLGLVPLPTAPLRRGLRSWEGNAAVVRQGEFASAGLFAASDSFPQGTLLQVENPQNGKTVRVTVVEGSTSGAARSCCSPSRRPPARAVVLRSDPGEGTGVLASIGSGEGLGVHREPGSGRESCRGRAGPAEPVRWGAFDQAARLRPTGSNASCGRSAPERSLRRRTPQEAAVPAPARQRSARAARGGGSPSSREAVPRRPRRSKRAPPLAEAAVRGGSRRRRGSPAGPGGRRSCRAEAAIAEEALPPEPVVTSPIVEAPEAPPPEPDRLSRRATRGGGSARRGRRPARRSPGAPLLLPAARRLFHPRPGGKAV